MKKILVSILTILYFLFLFGCTTQINSDELRLRIIANSNSEVDQTKKKEIKEYLKNNLQEELVNLQLEKMQTKLEEAFPNDAIVVEKTVVGYEAKTYQGKILPSGYYETILITIGEGKGKNFWTLLYPEFFNISFEDDHEIEYHSYFYDLFHQE